MTAFRGDYLEQLHFLSQFLSRSYNLYALPRHSALQPATFNLCSGDLFTISPAAPNCWLPYASALINPLLLRFYQQQLSYRWDGWYAKLRTLEPKHQSQDNSPVVSLSTEPVFNTDNMPSISNASPFNKINYSTKSSALEKQFHHWCLHQPGCNLDKPVTFYTDTSLPQGRSIFISIYI